MTNKLESIVIVTGEHGSVATVRFSDYLTDRIISANNKNTLYSLVENYVKKVLSV